MSKLCLFNRNKQEKYVEDITPSDEQQEKGGVA